MRAPPDCGGALFIEGTSFVIEDTSIGNGNRAALDDDYFWGGFLAAISEAGFQGLLPFLSLIDLPTFGTYKEVKLHFMRFSLSYFRTLAHVS